MKRLARIDLAVYTRQMRRQSIWCGTVVALSVVFAALNLLPPVDIYYEVSGKVLLEPIRVKGLVSNLKSSIDWSQSIRLKDFQVLDRSDLSHSRFSSASCQGLPDPDGCQSAINPTDVLLLNVKSLWTKRGNYREFHSWLETVTRPQLPPVPETELDRSIRMARWELSAARHYAAQHLFLAGDTASSSKDSQTGTFRLVSADGSKGPVDISSKKYTPTPASVPDASALVSQDPVGSAALQDAESLALDQSVAKAEARLAGLERERSQALSQSMGTLQITDALRERPLAGKIPLWMALSVIVLGLASGTIAGGLQSRLQSGGIYEPLEVAHQLTGRGLKIVSHIQLPTDQLESSDWLEMASQQASGAGRRTARHITLLAECGLALWFMLIVGRFMMDPIWRLVLLDSPLAAFGRLLSGLP